MNIFSCPSTSSRRTDLVAGAALVLAWSSGFIGAEVGTRFAPAETLLAWRYVAAAALLVLVMVAVRRVPSRDGLLRHGAIGILCQGVYLGGVVIGVGLGVPAGTAALIAAAQPLVVAALEQVILGTRTTPGQRAGLALGIIGVALVVSSDIGGGTAPAWAYLLPLVGMLGLSLGTVLDQRWHGEERLLDSLTVQTVVVAFVMVAAAAATGGLTPPASAGFWWAVVWVVVLSTFGGYGCYFWVLKRSGPTAVSSWLYLTPPSTMVWAAAAFGQRPGALAVTGTAVCAAAVLIAIRTGPAGARRTSGRPRVTFPAWSPSSTATRPDTCRSSPRKPSTPPPRHTPTTPTSTSRRTSVGRCGSTGSP